MSSFETNPTRLANAVNDFHDVRRKAAMESILARLRGKSTDLLSYDEVRQRFRTIESARRTLENIPIDKIVGSVGRYSDFSRSFLPRYNTDEQRWAFVRMGMDNMQGLPPIDTYKVGDVYFILDGHHRVSVAREMGAEAIEGYVTPVYTRVPLSPGDSPDDLIIKSEYDDFLTRTHLDDLRPEGNLMVTEAGRYPELLEHIAVHRYFMSEKAGREVPFQEAVTDWYDTVYLPMVRLIRERNLLRDFPKRTETDLYLWIMDHRVALSGGDSLGWEVRPELAATDFVQRYSPTTRRVLPRLAHRVADLLIPPALEAGPPPGYWRREHEGPRRDDRMFEDILVTVPESQARWPAVDMAIEVARREDARLTGLHVLEKKPDGKPLAPEESAAIDRIREEFLLRCGEKGVTGRLIVERGTISHVVCARSPWVDLVVFRLNFPPPTQPLRRLRSGSRFLIRRCSAPVFAIPDAPARLDSALLAFGPGPKAEEALYVATYLAGRWKTPLTVLTVRPARGAPSSGPTPLERARKYLEDNGVEARYVEVEGDESRDPARAILLNAEAANAAFLVMGGYESGPLRETLFSSTVDRVLRSTRRPVLLCR